MKRVTGLLIAALMVLAVILPTVRAGAQTATVTDDNLNQMIANAKTPADHEAIAAYYDKEAARLAEYARLHHSTHETYEKFRLKPPDMAHHCDELAKSYQRGADQATALAKEHRAMEKEAGGEQ